MQETMQGGSDTLRFRARLKSGLVNGLLLVATLGLMWGISEIVLARYEAIWLLSMNIQVDDSVIDATSTAADLKRPGQADGFKWQSDGNNLIHIRSQDKKLVYELRPNVQISDIIKTNSAGFRDHEFSTEKPADVYRIIAVGDSLTFGWFERAEETYPKVLEAMLNAQGEAPRKFEVYNMAVGGYNAEQELELIQTKALAFHPDAIVVGYCINDWNIGCDAGLWRHFTRSWSRTVDFVTLKIMQAKGAFNGTEVLKRNYGEMAEVSRAARIPIVVLIFPVAGDVGRDDLCAAKLCGNLGLPFVDLYDVYSAAGMQNVLHRDGIHPTARGHRLAAEELFRYLKEHVL